MFLKKKGIVLKAELPASAPQRATALNVKEIQLLENISAALNASNDSHMNEKSISDILAQVQITPDLSVLGQAFDGDVLKENHRSARELLARIARSGPQEAIIFELLARASHFGRAHTEEALAWKQAADLSQRPEFKVCEASAWLQVNEIASAHMIVTSLLKTNPDRFDVQALAADVAYRKGDRATALSHWDRAANIDPKNLNAQLQRGNILVELGMFDAAKKCFDLAATQWPDSALLASCYARMHFDAGSHEKALNYAKQALEDDRNSIDAATTLGQVLDKIGRSDEACTVLRTVLAKRIGDVEILTLLAQAEEHAGRPAIAIATWRGLQHFEPTNVRARVEISRLENRNQPRQAFREALVRIAQEFPLEPSALIEIANIDRAEARWLSVEALWNRILLLDLKHPTYWLKAAAALNECGKQIAAEAVLWKAVNKFPDDVLLLDDALELSTSLEHQDKAVEAGERLVRSLNKLTAGADYASPDDSNPLFKAYTRLTWLHFNVNDFDKTEIVCEEIGKVWPNSAFYLEIKAMIALRRRQWKQALQLARSYNALFPYYHRGVELEFEALVGANKFADAAQFVGREDLTVRFPEASAQLLLLRNAVRTALPPTAVTSTRLVIDVTSLASVVGASAAPGGIERTIVEVVLELFDSWKGNLTLVNWKTTPVEVSIADFRSAIFPDAYTSGDDLPLNPFTKRSLLSNERRYEPSSNDIVVILGSAWHYDGNNAILAAYKSAGAKVSIYIHDLLQLYYPELVSEKWARIFRNWIGTALDQADVVMVNSLHSGREITQFCEETGRSPIESVKIELGDDYRCIPKILRTDTVKLSSVLRLSKRAGYVMYVSAIGKRKNHGFAVRAWNRLSKTLGQNCPTLVFVGSPGDGMVSLDADLKATDYAGGKVMLLHNVNDAALENLYSNCLFTIFPSLCEGWGLPIAEALSRGKVCLSSNTTSMPEVGGDFADYFDPSDEDYFVELARSYIKSPERREKRESEIAIGYERREWKQTTSNILALLEARLNPSGNSILKKQPRAETGKGVIQVCASIGKQCGIASYASHVAAALRRQGRDSVIVRGIEECSTYLMTGQYQYVLVQHEYGLYDSFNASLAGPDTTGDLVECMEKYAERFPTVRQAVIMHTIDMKKHDLRERSQMLFNSTIPIITLSSSASRHTRAMFVEHGIHLMDSDTITEPQKRKASAGNSLTVASFGFLSPHKRIDKMLEACAETGSQIVGNFACDSTDRINQTRALIERLGVKGRVTYDFKTDQEIAEILRAGDVAYFPQGPISYWATTGSARVAMAADRPVITSPEDQFEDMAAGSIFATDASLPCALRRLSNPDYYSQIQKRLREFRSANSIGVVYSDALSLLDNPETGEQNACARSVINSRDVLDIPPADAALSIYAAALGRRPSADELNAFVDACSELNASRIDLIKSVAERGIAGGNDFDLRENGNAGHRDCLFHKIDGNRLVSVRHLMMLPRKTLVVEAMLEIAKRLPTAEEQNAFESLLPMHDHPMHQALEMFRSMVRAANGERPVKTISGDRRAYLYLAAPVPGRVQWSRTVYRLSNLAAHPKEFVAIAVFRALCKRDPSLTEHLKFLTLSGEKLFDEIRLVSHDALGITMIDDVSDVAMWELRNNALGNEAYAIAEGDIAELTGDNLALLEHQRLVRTFPEFLLNM